MADDTKPPEQTAFYIPSANEVDRIAVEASAPAQNTRQSMSAAHITELGNVAMSPSLTAPQLTDIEAVATMNEPFRSRAYSAPSILFQQVGMQLRNISDDYNSEYNSRNNSPPQNRRTSLPAILHELHIQQPNTQSAQQQTPISYRTQSSLYNTMQTFRALHSQQLPSGPATNPSRRRTESITEEETEDHTWAPD